MISIPLQNNISLMVPSFPSDCSKISILSNKGFLSSLYVDDINKSEDVSDLLLGICYLSHAEIKETPSRFKCNNEEAVYGIERTLKTTYDAELCVDIEGGYARVVFNGTEEGYWTADEILDDPNQAVGALIGCLIAPDALHKKAS